MSDFKRISRTHLFSTPLEASWSNAVAHQTFTAPHTIVSTKVCFWHPLNQKRLSRRGPGSVR